jgi:hypothetical protein
MSTKQIMNLRLIVVFTLLAMGLYGPAVAPSHAQILSGSMVGNVRDISEAFIPGAEVTIRNLKTNQTRSTVTTDTGAFSFVTLAPGDYEVSVAKPGFRPLKRSEVNVGINNVTRIDVQLELGAITEAVTVSTGAGELQTDRAEVRAELSAVTLDNVPSPPGRNYQSMFVMLPGFSPPGSQISIPGNPSRALIFNVNGTNGQGSNTRIDGASSTNIWRPSAVAYVPALESIETVNVVTSSFTPEIGLAGGAMINVQIKSGTNARHGSAFEYYDGNSLEARPFFLPQNQDNGKLVFNQFGATLGGPIVKDKLFYFASYEGTLNHALAGGIVSIPTPAMRGGDLSGSTTPIYDPLTGNSDGTGRTLIPGSQIPLSRMPFAVQKILPLWPNPTLPGSQNNYYATGVFFLDRHTLDTKVNWNVTPKLSTFARYSYLRFSTENDQTFGAALGGAPLPPVGGQAGLATGHSTSFTAAATYVMLPTFVLDAYYGFTRAQADSRQPLLDQKIGLDTLRLPGTNGTRWFEGGWPQFNIANFALLGAPNNFQPNLLNDPQFQVVANAAWTRGSHNIRFGTDIYKQDLNQLQAEFFGAFYGAQGGFGFAAGQTSAPGARTSEFNSFASFLLGATSNLGRNYLAPEASDGYTLRSWQYSAYVQDQWQVSRKLTATFGVRWEYFPMPTRADRGVELYDFATNKMLVCGVGSVPRDCGVSMSKKGFVPRAGLAYRVSDTLVIRAGYGITNDPYNLLRPFRLNYPELINLNTTSLNGYAPASQLSAGIPPPVVPDFGNGIISIPGDVAVNTIIGNQFKRGYIQSWNFTVQKRLGHEWTGEAGYVATRSVNQLAFFDRNAGTVGGGVASQPLNILYGRTVRTAQVTGLGTYKYDSLQTRLEHRFSKGYEVGVVYTFSKSLGIAGNDNGDGLPLVQAPGYYRLNRARTDLDHAHNMEIHSVLQLPFGRGRKFAHGGVAAALLGGWQLNGLLSLYTGQPFNVTAPGTSLNAPGSTQRADQVLPVVAKLGRVGPGQPFYDTAAFAQVTQVRFGTAGFYVLDSPGTVNLDTGLFRSFRIREGISLQFRAEVFNTTNTPHFGNPNGSVGGSSFMTITSTRGTGREGIDQRLFRFGLRLGF